MYESGKQERLAEESQAAILTQLEILNETLMAVLIQTSRTYDIIAAQAAGTKQEGIIAILDDHEKGQIYSAAPSLKSFGGEEPTPES